MSRPITDVCGSATIVMLLTSALCLAPAAIGPAHAARATADFAGFTAEATATPLKIEVYEPAIPIPADPQFELDFSYTRADGTSGPTGTARASALWPGDSVGEGWKTVGGAIGLPDELTKDGYPIQVNAESPGATTHSSQEPMPGIVTRADAGDQRATAKAGYSTAGDTSQGQLDGDPEPTNPLTALSSGDLSALGSALTGTTSSGDDQAPTRPLGAFSALVDVGGVQSVSTTDYSGDTLIARSTSRLAEISLVGGLVKLTGVEVVARTTSNLADGAKSTDKVRIGGITIAGQSYAITPDGIEGGGAPPVPGLPADPTAALKTLGIGIEMPKPQIDADGPQGDIAVRGIQVTIDTTPLRSALPALPIGDLVGGLPDEAGQLKSLLLALGEAHPKVVLTFGANTATAATAAGFDIGEQPAAAGSSATGTPSGSAPAGAGSAPAAGADPEVAPAPAAAPASASAALSPASAVPGLPPLGSIPAMVALLGLVLASGAGWYLRRAGGLLFGVGSSCSHGLKAGVPDLRKA